MSQINNNQYNLNLPQDGNDNNFEVTAGDFFAGGGGVTHAMHNIPGMAVKWVLNHDKTAIRTNLFHHKNVKHYWSDVYVQDEHELEPVDFAWASIECTQHSRAKGGKDKEMGSYTMGWELVRYMKHLQPLVIGIENVPEFKKWSPVCDEGKPKKDETGKEFERWKKAIMDLGYNYIDDVRNAADDGIPTRRVRYFAFFYRDGIDISFPEFTHSKTGLGGKLKHLPCKNYLDLNNVGESIFGRQFNENLPKHVRKQMSPNSERRIGGGAKKFHPEFVKFICNYYGGLLNELRVQSVEAPLNTVTCSNRHQVITIEKLQFIMDHCHTDNYNSIDEPINPQLTRQTKQLVTFDELVFIAQYYGTDQTQSIDVPLNTATTKDRHQVVRIEKAQFIAHHFNSSGKPETQCQSLDAALNSIMTTNKASLISLIEALDGFDIKARFLNREELAACSSFPRDYFSKEGLNLSNKDAVKMIGNAVPPEWAKKLIAHNLETIKAYKLAQKAS